MSNTRGTAMQVEKRRAFAKRHGATLVELMVSSVSASMLAVGMMSAIFLATQANQIEPTTTNMLEASVACQEMAAELRYALSFSERTATAVTFKVADRNSDAIDETIRYAWSGTLSAPLTRQYNGGTAAVVVDNVHAFQCDYFVNTITSETGVIPENESAEQLLKSYTPTTSLGEEDVKTDGWVGEYFWPDLATGVVRWSVTKVELQLKRINSNETFSIALRPANSSDLPTATVLEQKIVNSNSIGTSYAWYPFTFTTVQNLGYNDDLVLVLSDDVGNQPIKVQKRDSAETNSQIVKSTNQGALWYAESSKNLLYRIYGKVITYGSPQTVAKDYLQRVGITLQVSNDVNLKVKTQTRVLNKPEVTSP